MLRDSQPETEEVLIAPTAPTAEAKATTAPDESEEPAPPQPFEYPFTD